MKTFIKVMLAAFVLSMVPTAQVVAQMVQTWYIQSDFCEGLARVQNSIGEYGYIDKTDDLVIPCKWKNASDFIEGRALVQNYNGKWGYIDKTGKVVIPCKWKNASIFHEGLACVKDDNGKRGYIDKTGKVVIPCKWTEASSFGRGKANVWDENHIRSKIDKTGKIIWSERIEYVSSSIDPNSLTWPKPNYASKWLSKADGTKYKIVNFEDGQTTITYFPSTKRYHVERILIALYTNYNDAEAAAYYSIAHGLRRTRGLDSSFR